MTREEAYNRIDAIVTNLEFGDEYVTISNMKDYEALRLARKLLEYESCEDCISREAARDLMYHKQEPLNEYDLDSLPSVTPKLKTGHWKITNSFCICDQCGYETRPWNNTLFCPNCGVRMDDLISRQTVLKQLKGCLTGGETEYQYVKLHIDSIAPVKSQEPCEDYISRQAVLDEAFEVDTKEYGRIEVVGVDAIDSLPPVTPMPKTGHWIDGHCSECGCDVPAYIIDWEWQNDMDAKYCPYCGAKMERSGEE